MKNSWPIRSVEHYIVMNYHEFAKNYAMDDIHNNIINVNEWKIHD